ncbi:hypothetical protein [Streptomyces sp. NPDC001889]
MSDFETAVQQMLANADRCASVARQILAGAEGLPALLDVRPEPTASVASVTLQTSTIADARAWAAYLGTELTVTLSPAPSYWEGQGTERARAMFLVNGVTVDLAAVRFIPAAEWAAMREATEVTS